MKNIEALVPAPPVIRHKLADNIRERRLLKSLLRLSLKAAEERRESEGREQAMRAERELNVVGI